MAFSGVPIAIGGGGAEVPGDLWRQLVADFFYGSEGVIRSTDCAIKALPAPDDSVRMIPGGVAVLNRALGGDREAYYDYNDEDDIVPIEGTGSSGGRSDLIVAQVEDPFAAGTQYQLPANPKKGPYIHPRVVPNVDKRIYNVHQLPEVRSAVTLARIDQPANNNVITQSMIVDLRSIANGPQRYQEPDPPPDPPPPPIGTNPWTESRIQATKHTLNYLDRSWVYWPSAADWQVYIPKEANGVDIFFMVENPQQWDHHVWGEFTVGIGDHWGFPTEFDMDAIPVPSTWPLAWSFNGLTSRPNRIPIIYSTTLAFTGAYKDYPGTVKRLRARARMYNDANTRGRLVADTKTVVYAQLNYKSYPIIN